MALDNCENQFLMQKTLSDSKREKYETSWAFSLTPK